MANWAVWKAIDDWLHQPFRQPISALELFFGIGLIIAILFLWSRIVRAIGEAV